MRASARVRASVPSAGSSGAAGNRFSSSAMTSALSHTTESSSSNLTAGTSVVGTIGHISIIVYMLNNYDLRKHAIVALGILGHLAMQGVHWIEHYEKKHSLSDRRFTYVRVAAFSALLAFYLNYAASNRAEAVGRYLLAGLYIVLLLEQVSPIRIDKSI